MKYRIREYTDINTRRAVLWYPQYRRHWYSCWVEGKWCESELLARVVIDGWKNIGICKKNKYIKV